MADKTPQFVYWSQMNGIVCYGEVLAVVSWDEPNDSLLVRYWYDPADDPPRRSYTLIEKSVAHPIGLPRGFKRAQ